MKTIAGKHIVLTGATSGIGRCLARILNREGAGLAVCGRSPQKMDQLTAELENPEAPFYSELFDISEEARIAAFLENTRSRLGSVDVLVNCAGVNSERARVEDITTDQLEWMLKINLTAPFVFMREVYREMRDRKEGMIINVLSTVCNYSNEGIASYTASKAGLDALTKVLRKEAREYNVKICSVYPGGVNTEFRSEPRPLYMGPETVAESIVSMMKMNEDACVDELVLRPMIEKNYS